jgi:hypothetical protein
MPWKGMLLALLLAPLASCAEPARVDSDYYLLALAVAPALRVRREMSLVSFCCSPPL